MPNTTNHHANNSSSIYHPIAIHNNIHSYTSSFPVTTTIVRSCTEFSHERSHSSSGTVVSKLLIQPAHLKSQSVSHWPSPVSRNPGVTLLHASDHISVLPVRTIPVGKLKQLLASTNSSISPLQNQSQITDITTTAAAIIANGNDATPPAATMIPSPPIILPSSTSFSPQSASSPKYHYQQQQQKSSLGRPLRVAQPPPPPPSYVPPQTAASAGTMPSTSFFSSSSAAATSAAYAAQLHSKQFPIFNSVPSLSNTKTFARSVASASALVNGMERFDRMSYDELLELAQKQQRQIEANEAELDERRKTVAQLGVAKRMAGGEVEQQQQAKMQMTQIRTQIERDELELAKLSQCQRESRQLREHNQRQCHELQQLETLYAQDDQQLRQAVQKVDSLRAQLELLYQRRAAAADAAIARQRQINGGRIGTASGQQQIVNGNNMNTNKLANEQRPKASVSPFNKQDSSYRTQNERNNTMESEISCTDQTDNSAMAGGQTTKKAPAPPPPLQLEQVNQQLTTSNIQWRRNSTTTDAHNQRSQHVVNNYQNGINNNHHLLMPPASVDKISLRRNSINQAKRNSLLAESGDEQQQQILALLLAEQRRGRTHVSFGHSWNGAGQQEAKHQTTHNTDGPNLVANAKANLGFMAQEQFGWIGTESAGKNNLPELSGKLWSAKNRNDEQQQSSIIKGYSNGQVLNAKMEQQKHEESEGMKEAMPTAPSKHGSLSPVKRTISGVPPESLEAFNQIFTEQDVLKTEEKESQSLLNDVKMITKRKEIEDKEEVKKDETGVGIAVGTGLDESLEEVNLQESMEDEADDIGEDIVRMDELTMKADGDDDDEKVEKDEGEVEDEEEEVQLLDQICLDKPMGMEDLEMFEDRQEEEERNGEEAVTKLESEKVEFELHQSPPLSVSSTDTSANGCCYSSDEERIYFDKSWHTVPSTTVGIKGILQRRQQHKDNEEEQKKILKKRVKFDLVVLFLDVAYEGQYDLLVELAAKIDNISVANSEGITALHYAICASNQDIVHFLIDNGADVNALDVDGWSPLHCAASCDNLPMLRLLVENGACPFATTISKSETAAQIFDETTEYGAAAQYMELVEQYMGEVNDAKIYAAYSYRAQRDDELSFEEGDQLKVLRKNELDDDDDEEKLKEEKEGSAEEELGDGQANERRDRWWLCEHVERGERGLVPRNYLALFPSWKHRDRYQINFQLPMQHLLPETDLDPPHINPSKPKKKETPAAIQFTDVLTVPKSGNNTTSKTNSLGHPELSTYA